MNVSIIYETRKLNLNILRLLVFSQQYNACTFYTKYWRKVIQALYKKYFVGSYFGENRIYTFLKILMRNIGTKK